MFKKSIVFITSLLLVFSISVHVSATANNFTDDSQRQKSLVALGDSITSGYGLFDMLPSKKNPTVLNQRLVSKDAYPQLVGDALGYRVTNLAVSGWSSTDLLQMISHHQRYRMEVAQADLIILNIGGNDVLGYLVEVDFTNIEFGELLDEIEIRLFNYYLNLGFILNEIRQLNPTAPILQYGFFNPLYLGHTIADDLGDGFMELYQLLNFIIPLINQSVLHDVLVLDPEYPAWNPISGFESYAEYFDHLYYVDVFSSFEEFGFFFNKADLFADEVHPSQIGHHVIAEITINLLFAEVLTQ